MTKRFGAVQALDRRRLRGPRRRGRRARRRQRRRQVHARSRRSPASSPATRASTASTARRSTIQAPHDATRLGIATVYQDLALCDNLDVVANLFLGAGDARDGPQRAARVIDEIAMEQQARRAARSAVGDDAAQRAHRGRLAVRRAAAVGRDRALAARRAEGRDPRRADRRARRRADARRCSTSIRRLRERGLGVILISHNLARRLRGRRTASSCCGSAAGSRRSRPARRRTSEIVAAITGARGSSTPTSLRPLTSRRAPAAPSTAGLGCRPEADAPQAREPERAGPDGHRASRSSARCASHRARADLDHLPVAERQLPQLVQPHEPGRCRSRPSGSSRSASCWSCCSARSTSRSAPSAACAAAVMAVLNVKHGWAPIPAIARGVCSSACGDRRCSTASS